MPGEDEAMARAAGLATSTHPHPNPRVGAVVLDSSGDEIGSGSHLGPGTDHAEVIALREAGYRAQGATVVVTLEPCVHQGRTAPCVDALIKAGISRVVISALDPDERVQGRGVERLRSAGIDVVTGIGPGEAVDPAYFHHRRTGRAHVTLKLAATLDGQIAAADGTSQWISGQEARANAHQLRAQADAVMVGAGTIISDDPSLDVRLVDSGGFQPRAVVVVGKRPLPADARIWGRNPLLVNGSDNLSESLKSLADQGLLGILVEGGPTIARKLWAENLVDKGVFYFASIVAGGVGRPLFTGDWSTLSKGRRVSIESVNRLGQDLRVDFVPI